MTDGHRESRGSAAFWMLLSALLFGYVGYAMIWPVGTSDAPNWIAIVMMWTMRLTAIGFGISLLVIFANTFLGELLYAVVGLVCAIGCGTVLAWGFAPDTSHPLHPLLLALFGAMTGFTSWQSLSGLMAVAGARRAAPPAPTELR